MRYTAADITRLAESQDWTSDNDYVRAVDEARNDAQDIDWSLLDGTEDPAEAVADAWEGSNFPRYYDIDPDELPRRAWVDLYAWELAIKEAAEAAAGSGSAGDDR